MLKSIVLLFFMAIVAKIQAQRCLDVNIVTAMDKLETPGDAESSFKKCITGKNDKGQVTIQNYGTDLQQLDTLVIRTSRDFNTNYVTGMSTTHVQAPTQQQIDATKALAEEVKNMTPEQQKEWAMKMAHQNNAGSANTIPDDPSISKLIMQSHDLAVNQMKTLNDEFYSKILALNNKADAEIKTITRGDKSKCPSDKTGYPYCDCPNRIEADYWKKVMVIRNKYDAQKVEIYQTYLPKLKTMAGEVDNAVVKCKFGDAVHSSQMKGLLYSAQSSAYGNAFLVTYSCTEQIRKEGSDAKVNKLNSDLGVFDISCATK